MKILDCTIRDGGYYTNWDFDKEVVATYLKTFNSLPVDYLEVGYRNPKLKGYYGEYYFCPPSTLKFLKDNTNKKLVIILNEKDVRVEMIEDLLHPCVGLIDLVRIAIDPANFERALLLAKAIKEEGFEVGFNVMYMSTWQNYPSMMENLNKLDGLVDYFYLVDSFGGVFPADVRNTIRSVKEKTNVMIGFHGHNNLEMALANTLAAIDEGVDIIDATITGMGRGAGNLKTELLLTVLNERESMEVDFNALSELVGLFQGIQEVYQWGTSLPYMVSGVNSLPQKQVMEWVSKRYYSINSITRALSNQSKNQKDNHRFEVFRPEKTIEKVLIIGGGDSASEHQHALKELLVKNTRVFCLIHASSKNALAYQEIQNEQFFCLVGNEGTRLEKVFSDLKGFEGKCILPPYPRKMGTYVPNSVIKNTYELSEVTFTELIDDSHTVIALQTAIELGAKEIYFAGYDGYSGGAIATKDQELFIENTQLFNVLLTLGIKCFSITPTKYKVFPESSVYQIIG